MPIILSYGLNVNYISCMCKHNLVSQAQKHTGTSNVDKTQGVLLYHLATRMKTQISAHRPLLIKYVATRKLVSEQQLNGE